MSKAKTFRLAKRPCRLRVGLNGRGEKRGDDQRVPACDITIEGIILTHDELNSVCQDVSTWDSWYVKEAGVIRPRDWLKRAQTVTLGVKFVDCSCSIFLPDDEEARKYNNARFAKLEFKPLEGGNTELTQQVQLLANNDDTLHSDDLMAFFGEDIHMAFAYGKLEEKIKRQQELSLTTEGSSASDEAQASAPH